MYSASVRCLVIVLAFMLSSCSSSVRSLQIEEIRDSDADEVVLFTTEGRIISTQPDSCFLLSSRPDSEQVIEIQGREYTGLHRKASRPFHGQLSRAAVDSIQGRYRPSIDPVVPVLVGLAGAIMIVTLLANFHIISFKQ